MFKDKLLVHFPIPAILEMSHFGIDISSRSVKFVELIGRYKIGSRLKVGKYGEIELEEGVVDEGVVRSPEKLGAVLKKIHAEPRGRHS